MLFRPLDPALEMPGLHLVAVDRLAAEKKWTDDIKADMSAAIAAFKTQFSTSATA